MQTIEISNLVGLVNPGELLRNEAGSEATVLTVDKNLLTITDPTKSSFLPNDRLTFSGGATAILQSASEINVLDIFSIFGGKIPTDFSFSKFIENLPIAVELTQWEDLLDMNETDSDPNYPTEGYPVEKQTTQNPVQPGKEAVVRPSTRVVQNIANEPIYENNSKYPYNKSYKSESGHLKEIDDTPGYERLLDQHATGTYQEMQSDGNLITKVVNDKYTIVAGDGYVTVEGDVVVNVMGDCNLRVGGYITATSDAGVNLVTKGDFRVKAKSIHMESTSGAITAKSARNITATAKQDLNLKGKTNHIDSVQLTSISTGEQLIVDSQKISMHAKTDAVIAADAGTFISSKADTNILAQGAMNVEAKGAANIKAGGATAISSSSVEIDANLNVKNVTNMKAGATPVDGYGAAAAGAAAETALETPVPAKESKGSGISVSPNPDMNSMLTDDDPEARATAIKQAIENETVDSEELDSPPPDGSSRGTAPGTDTPADQQETPDSDNSAPKNVAPSLTKPTVGNLGTKVNDNLKLSPRFTVGHLSKYAKAGSHIVQAQHGLTVTQIVENLQLVAVNCLEKIKDKYPDLIVSSGFRAGGRGKSQHEKGQACDMQFPRANKAQKEYFEIAKWMKDNLPYDQLLLEYKDYGSQLPWIHISFKASGNRREVFTLFNDQTYKKGLVDLAYQKGLKPKPKKK